MYYNDGVIYPRTNPDAGFDIDFDDVWLLEDDGYIHTNRYLYDPEDQILYDISSDYIMNIYDRNLKLFGFFRHSPLHTWTYINRYDNIRDVKYRFMNDQVEYVVANTRRETTTFTFNTLSYTESTVDLPFYSHISTGTLWLVLVAVFVPFLNNEKFFTYIDYDSVLNKDKKKNEA